jgi:hypothetical protein
MSPDITPMSNSRTEIEPRGGAAGLASPASLAGGKEVIASRLVEMAAGCCYDRGVRNPSALRPAA